MAEWLGSTGAWVDAGSGLLLVVLAVFVASRRPRRPVNVAFAIFTACWGAAFVAGNVVRVDGVAPPITFAAFGLLLWPAIVALGVLAVRFPARVGHAEGHVMRWLWGPPALVAGAVLLTVPRGRWEGFGWAHMVYDLSWTAFIAAMLGVLWLMSARYRWHLTEGSSRTRTNLALVSAALVVDPSVRAGFYMADRNLDSALAFVPGLLVLAGLWMWNTARAHGGDGRTARRVAWFILGLMVVGAVLNRLLGGGVQARDSGIFGTARALGVLVLAYAMLRHDLLDLDVRVKWTIKQSTLAAIFIATFFIVSEGAAAVFEAQTGSTILGIMAAGALVFAIVPLQRFAERLSERAMPGVKGVAAMDDDERADLYRQQAEQAWSDGAVDRNERAMLEKLREGLGLSVEQAHAIELKAANPREVT